MTHSAMMSPSLLDIPFLSWLLPFSSSFPIALPQVLSQSTIYPNLLFQTSVLRFRHLISLPLFLPPSMKLRNGRYLLLSLYTSKILTPVKGLDTRVISNADVVPVVMFTLVPLPSFKHTESLLSIKSSITFPFGSRGLDWVPGHWPGASCHSICKKITIIRINQPIMFPGLTDWLGSPSVLPMSVPIITNDSLLL